MFVSITRALFAFVIATTSVVPARAQCEAWSDRFFGPGAPGDISAFATFDDGSGPALFVGGDFLAVGPTEAKRIAKWDGTTWSPLDNGVGGGVDLLPAEVLALVVFDDGSGPALYAGGSFTTASGAGGLSGAKFMARWDGANWTNLGTGLSGVAGTGVRVRALAVFDDGTGPALYAGGTFSTAGGMTARGIARWNGTSWSDVGGGIGAGGGAVYSLVVHDDGSGPALFMGGTFGLAGGVSAKSIAKWNGTTWSEVGGGMTGDEPNTNVYSLCVHDDGTGASVFAGGRFHAAGGTDAEHIAKWNGTSWSALGSGTSGEVLGMASYDDGGGAALYAGGSINSAGDVSAKAVAKWNGSSWSSIRAPGEGADGLVQALTVFDAGLGPKLVMGGFFESVLDVPAWSVVSFDGTDCTSLVEPWTGIASFGGADARAMAVYDDGAGAQLYLGGDFGLAGGVVLNHFARWDGTNWSSPDGGIGANGTIQAMTVFDDGGGSALYVGGAFTTVGGVSANRIAKWNGTSWSSLGTGMESVSLTPQVFALAVFDDGSGPALFAGGSFNTAGGVTVDHIAKWNGTSWSSLSTGVQGTTSPFVFSLTVFDDGGGPALYAGGRFPTAGGVSVNHIGKWDGATWSALAGGSTNPVGGVRALAVFDSGDGPTLYAAGEFATGGPSAHGIGSWNGTSWSALGTGVSGTVFSLAVFDQGSTSALYVGGQFDTAGGITMNGIAKWSGGAWEAMDGGMIKADNDFNNPVQVLSLAVFDDGADGAADLYAAGRFAYAGGGPSPSFAEWHGCPPGTAYCFGDGLDPAVTAQCPCSNFGAPGHGCANSNVTLGGARLWASGTTNPNTVLFTCEGIPNNALSTFWRGTANTAAGGVVHDGIQCLGGTTIRFGQQFAGQLGNPPFTVSVGATALPPGSTRYYQVLYRNPAPAFCPPGTYNFSNGYRVTW